MGEEEGFIGRHFKTLVFGIAVAALALSLVMFLSNQGLISVPIAKPNPVVSGDAGAPATPPGATGETTPSGAPIYTQQQAGSDTGSPVIDAISGEQTGVKCPNDYCLNEVQGSGSCPASSGQSGTYTERECYDYPDQAATLAACDNEREVYYEVCGVRQ